LSNPSRSCPLPHISFCRSAAVPAIPVMYLALVYHDLVPVLCQYLGGDRRRVFQSIAFGSLLPLSLFLGWEAVTLNAVGNGAAPGSVLSSLMDRVSASSSAEASTGGLGASFAPLLSSGLTAFALLAVATSFTCVSLNLIEYLNAELARIQRTLSGSAAGGSGSSGTAEGAGGLAGEAETAEGSSSAPRPQMSARRVAAFLFAIGPPCYIASAGPDTFLGASKVAVSNEKWCHNVWKIGRSRPHPHPFAHAYLAFILLFLHSEPHSSL
jgi:hypothetical protein